MSGRTFNLSGYRYGFNGKENDIETVGTGEGTQDYGMRIYNPSLGKFLSVDPLQMEYPMLTPYQFASNSPIVGIDRDGLEIAHYSLTYSNGKPVLQLLGVQMRLAAATEDLLEAFGVDYTLNEYSGSIINGLSFKVFYDGAEFTFSTVGDVANFAKGGEEKAKAARAAYIAEQLMIAVAVTDLKQAELESEQALEGIDDSYYYYIKSEDRLATFLKVTNIQFLNSSGFNKVIFIKVKLRDRYLLEHFLFLENLNKSELILFNTEPDESKFDSLKKERLYSLFKIVENTQNNVLEAFLSSNSNYFTDAEINSKKRDVFLAYSENSHKFYFLSSEFPLFGINDFKKLVQDGSILSDSNQTKLKYATKKERRKTIEEITRNLKIEDFQISW